MEPAARAGDKIGHGATVTGAIDPLNSSSTLKIDGSPAARIGDAVICAWSSHSPTPVTAFISSGSSSVTNEGKGLARKGDTLSCGAIILTGSPTTKVN